jgi:hypothetical protein
VAPVEDGVAEDAAIHADEVEGDEDVETSRIARDPRFPTPEQIEEHNCTHLPFRDWCSFCIMGRGRGNQHKRNQGHESSVPVVGIDYFFITKGGLKKRGELEQELTPEGDLAGRGGQAQGRADQVSDRALLPHEAPSHPRSPMQGRGRGTLGS